MARANGSIQSTHHPGAAGGGHADPSVDPTFMDTFVAMVKTESDAGHFPDTWLEAGSAPSMPPTALSTTKELQAAFAALKFKISVDGQMGSETEGVIMAAQKLLGMTPTGEADDALRAALVKALT